MKFQKHKFEHLSSDIIGAAIEVHKILGPGFVESIYHNALKKELSLRNIPFETERQERIFYKDELMGEHRMDIVVNNEIVVELKSVREISDAHRAQLISYLKASKIRIGLLINFSKYRIQIKRMVRD